MNSSIWRGTLGAIVGYIIFAAPAALMFNLMGWDPHTAASMAVIVASTVVGLVAAGVGGYVGARIGRARWPGIVVAALIAVGALVSLATRPGGGAVWSQLVALVLLAPAALLGGYRARAGRSGA